MDALMGGRGKGLLAACLCAALAAGTANFARAATTANQRSVGAEWSALGEKTTGADKLNAATDSDGVNALLLSGAVAFNPDPNPTTPSDPAPAPTPTPTPTPGSGPLPIPPPPPPPPSGPNSGPGPAAPPPPITVSSPEPASLLIGLIGSACAGVVGWKRRNHQKAA
jgi:hypothetical protein